MIYCFTDLHQIIHDYIIDIVFSSVDDFFGGSTVYFILTVIAVSVLILQREKYGRILKFTVPFSGLVLLLFTFNPIMWNWSKTQEDGREIMGSLWLIMPMWIMVAYGYAQMLGDIKGKVKQPVAIVCVAAVFGLAGFPTVMTIEDYQKHDFILNGTYTVSGYEGSIEAAFDEDHVLTIGQKGSGEFIEGFSIELNTAEIIDVSLAYRAHIQDIGWYDWSPENTNVTYSPGYGIDCVQFMLYGKDACRYKLEYRIAFIGEDWQEWMSDGILVGIIDDDSPIEAIQIRLSYIESDATNTWTITQYSAYSTEPSMFYTIRNNEDGTLIAINGGGDHFSNQVRSIINLYGGHVDYWFVTHDDYWHAATLYGIQEYPNGIEVDNVYMMYPEVTDSFEIDGLQIQVFEGSMLKITGTEDSILFLGDNYCDMYEVGSISADYVEVELLEGNSIDIDLSGEMRPQAVFLDSPTWMIQRVGYGANDLCDLWMDNDISVIHQAGAPNSIPFN